MFDEEKWTSETKGLLLIDGMYNTILIPFGSDAMKELLDKYIREGIKYAREKIKAEYFAAREQLLKKAHAQIHAHRVEIFKDALTQFIAEQGVNT